MKLTLPLFVILTSIFLLGCPEKNEDSIKPDPATVTPAKGDTITSLRISWVGEQFFFGPRAFTNAVDIIEYFNLIYLPSNDKSTWFRLPITTDQFCDSSNFDCGNRGNVKIAFEDFDVESKTLPNDKYLVSSGAIFYPTKGSKIVISTIDGKPFFKAKTASKNYSVNKIEFVVDVPLDVNQTSQIAARLAPAQGIYKSRVFPAAPTAFERYWADPSIALPKEYGSFNIDFLDKFKGGTMQLFSSRRTKTELLALLKKAAENKYSIVRKWTNGPATPDNNLVIDFSVVTTLNNEPTQRFEILK
ncbi:hypothetical protein [Dyadobacter fermentans]|uniref:Lipoprotein n=1 Tax=Dyadobacter fermentans (strain ATCC 700827 / DSM 18053 / CIP 107007 / KCTC 52180 / NS114) TaxID=471854 RepID=C6VZQ1_DYAFD|nr:hypothetical protein [Dyadobacter fermentans]ACT93529.1 hypothetical protein Dfer_2310 [Dyadobacter fermentans DSM 18053]